MNEIKPLSRQSLCDMALQTSGGLDALVDLAVKNDVSLSEELAAGATLARAGRVDKLILERYEVQQIEPATEISPEDEHNVPWGGIGLMGIEIDFTIK